MPTDVTARLEGDLINLMSRPSISIIAVVLPVFAAIVAAMLLGTGHVSVETISPAL